MEKTIIIDGKEVRLKATGALPKRYKAQFGRDFFADLFSLESAAGKKKVKDALAIDFDIIYDITWTLAKTADNTIPDPITWLDSFDTFPIVDVTYEIKDMLAATIATKKK